MMASVLRHVMASGTLPDFYDYAEIPLDLTVKQNDQSKVRKYVTFGMAVY